MVSFCSVTGPPQKKRRTPPVFSGLAFGLGAQEDATNVGIPCNLVLHHQIAKDSNTEPQLALLTRQIAEGIPAAFTNTTGLQLGAVAAASNEFWSRQTSAIRCAIVLRALDLQIPGSKVKDFL